MTRMLLAAPAERGTGGRTATIAGGAADERVVELSRLVDAATVRRAIRPVRRGLAKGDGLADAAGICQISKVSKGRTTIEFNGTVAQVRNAFQTDIHKFPVNGKEHFANVSDPAIPEALAPVVKGVVALHNFRKKAAIHPWDNSARNMATGQITPLFTFTDVNGTFYAVGRGTSRQFTTSPRRPPVRDNRSRSSADRISTSRMCAIFAACLDCLPRIRKLS